MKITKMQVAIFFKDIVERPDIIIKPVVDSFYSSKLKSMPQFNPIPNNAPADIPRIMYNADNNSDFKINIGLSRMDLYYGENTMNVVMMDEGTQPGKTNIQIIENITSDQYQSIKQEVKQFLNELCKNVDVSRIGVSGHLYEIDPASVEKISNRYFTGKMSGCEELSIRYNRRTLEEKTLMNNICQINDEKHSFNFTVNDVGINVDEELIHILRDINNVPTDKKLDAKQIDRIIEYGFYAFSENGMKEVW